MAKESASKSTAPSTSSWWKERSKITAKPETKAVGSETRATKPKKKVKTEKAARAESGQTYYCEICGCEMVCASDSAAEVLCCEEPMCLVI
ncbi:MAG: hypothetical protein QSU88_10110 [Candidatus Methanoperedens sp.]|nr:hypothetical protein [Candidatus Methanoperedens sp.]